MSAIQCQILLESFWALFWLEYTMHGDWDTDPNTVYMEPDHSHQHDAYSNATSESVNTSVQCTNEYCVPDEDYIEMIEAYIFPSTYEWLLIVLHLTVFFVGLVGNALVCISVYRNHSMRTVTNYFIVNLAVADFLVILFCLPPSVLWDVTETWFFGSLMCKLVLYLQVSLFSFNNCFAEVLISQGTNFVFNVNILWRLLKRISRLYFYIKSGFT